MMNECVSPIIIKFLLRRCLPWDPRKDKCGKVQFSVKNGLHRGDGRGLGGNGKNFILESQGLSIKFSVLGG